MCYSTVGRPIRQRGIRAKPGLAATARRARPAGSARAAGERGGARSDRGAARRPVRERRERRLVARAARHADRRSRRGALESRDPACARLARIRSTAGAWSDGSRRHEARSPKAERRFPGARGQRGAGPRRSRRFATPRGVRSTPASSCHRNSDSSRRRGSSVRGCGSSGALADGRAGPSAKRGPQSSS